MESERPLYLLLLFVPDGFLFFLVFRFLCGKPL
jgi:hypothetical protein